MNSSMEKYGVIYKIALVLVVGIWIFSDGCFGKMGTTYNSHDDLLDPYHFDQSIKTSEKRFNEWISRRNKLNVEWKEIRTAAEAKATNYRQVDYFRDFEKLMNLEDRYRISLRGGILSPLNTLHDLSVKNIGQEGFGPQNKTDRDFIASIQKRAKDRSDRGPIPISGTEFLWSLLFAYLKIAFFWLLIYLIRFQEESYRVSLQMELVFCWWRFVRRVMFWPIGCFAYPLHEDTAEVIRFVRLKAQYLRYRPFGYQLTKQEIVWLSERARTLDYGAALERLRAMFGPQAIRRSVATAYLSLLIGIIFQPAIAWAGSYSAKMHDHFYGGDKTQIVCVEKTQFEASNVQNHSPPLHIDHDYSEATMPALPKLETILIWLDNIQEAWQRKLPQWIRSIDHVPLSSQTAAQASYANS